MDLPALFTSDSADQTSYLSILVTDHYVQSALWGFQNNQVTLIEKSDVHEFTDEKDCLVKTDLGLQELGKESEGVDEVIFGLEPDWVTGGEINEAKKTFLKRITTELSLKAIGFVVTVEALHQFLVKLQPQLSALVIQSEEKKLRVSFVRQGVLLRTQVVGKSGNLTADVTEALARWSAPDDLAAAYPSRILLTSDQLSDDELSSEEQEILNHDWVTEKLFLHPPIVEVLRPGTVLEAIVNEGGKAVAQSQGLAVVDADQTEQVLPPSAAWRTAPELPPSAAWRTASELPPNPVELVPIAETAVTDAEAVQAKSFGIPMAPSSLVMTAAMETPALKLPTIDEMPETAVSPPKPVRKLRLPKFMRRHGQYSHHPFILSGAVLGVLLFLVGGFFYLKFTTKVTVALVLKTVSVAKDVTINLDAAAGSVKPGELTLSATRLNQDFEKNKSLPTTGIKKVGDKAKGTVTIFNKTTSSKTFAAGTTLTSDTFKFTLDAEATIASASVVTSGGTETKTFGHSDVIVTAVEIGPESNLTKGKELKIASFDVGTYAAQSVNDFVGGSSREMRVVAEADRQKVLALVRSELLTDAAAAFKQSSQADTYTVPSGKVTIKDSVYSAKTGDEAEEINLAIKATVEGLTYQTDQLKPLALEALADKVPSEYELKPETLQILSDPQIPVSSGSTQVVVQANIAAQAAPKIDQEQLKVKVAGQSLERAEEILKAESLISSFSLKFLPPLSRYIVRRLPSSNRLLIETP